MGGENETGLSQLHRFDSPGQIMIKTADGKYGRLFIFDQGTVSSKAGAGHRYDTAIVWSDAATGFKVMASKSDAEQFKAAAAGKMKLDGMAFSRSGLMTA